MFEDLKVLPRGVRFLLQKMENKAINTSVINQHLSQLSDTDQEQAPTKPSDAHETS